MIFLEITDEIGKAFEIGDFHGLVGLSFPELSGGLPTIFDEMIK